MGDGPGKWNEPTVARERIYQGKIVSLDVLTVRLPNGREAKREIVRHPGAVAVLAVTGEGKILLVRQFRKALEKTTFEIPAGKLEPGEDPEAAARRELKEETGRSGGVWHHVFDFYTSPGFADEKMHFFAATGLSSGEAAPDEDEFVETVEVSDEEIDRMIRDGAICDAKTLTAVYWWRAHDEHRRRDGRIPPRVAF
jgi:ADP-ribose pyrophosphatase